MNDMPWAGKHVMVTGGAGFIGSHLAEALHRAGAARVVVLDSMKHGRKPTNPALELVAHEIGGAEDAKLERLLQGIDVLFHLAAEKHNQALDQPELVVRANIDGTLRLFMAAAAAGVKRVVFTSSLYAYGRMHGERFKESDAVEPSTVYGLSKYAGERLLFWLAESRGMSFIALRYFFVYGPRQFSGSGYKSVIVKNFERLLQGHAPIINGDGQQMLDYIYVDDVIDATMSAAMSPHTKVVVNIGSGMGVTVNDLIQHMARIAGSTSAPIHAPPDVTHGSRRVACPERAQKLLNFAPKVDLVTGLQHTFNWMKTGVNP